MFKFNRTRARGTVDKSARYAGQWVCLSGVGGVEVCVVFIFLLLGRFCAVARVSLVGFDGRGAIRRDFGEPKDTVSVYCGSEI